MSRYTLFRPRIRSRHPSHAVLRPVNRSLPLLPFKSVIRLGSTTDMRDTVSNGRDRIEVNTIEAIRNSSNKFKMKCLFTEDSVETADWWRFDRSADSFKTLHSEEGLVLLNIEELPYPIVSKNIFGSRNTGNIKHDNPDSLRLWMEGKNLDNYIFEKFYNYVREYRLHVTQDGCFYAIRKMLKRDTPEEYRWYRNDDHCVWILEDNEAFDKPVNWDDIVDHSVKALKAVGLDIGAIDVKVQSATKSDGSPREYPKFIILETNSAPSFGDLTAQKYIEELPKVLTKKQKQNNE